MPHLPAKLFTTSLLLFIQFELLCIETDDGIFNGSNREIRLDIKIKYNVPKEGNNVSLLTKSKGLLTAWVFLAANDVVNGARIMLVILLSVVLHR